MKFFTISLCLIVIIFYYVIGGHNFPDYSNYITISEKGGYLYFENEYFAEWISRAWLSNIGFILNDHTLSIDIFALLIQFSYIMWILSGVEKKDNISKYWITVFLAPLFLTTTLRGTVGYICLFQFFIGALTLKRALIFGFIAVSFHDSAAIPFILLAPALLLLNSKSFNIINALLWSFSFIFINFSQIISAQLLALVSTFGIGIREIYFQNYESPSLVKSLYANFILGLTFVVLINKGEAEKKLSLMLIMFACSMLYSIASTPAIRMLIYVFGICVVMASHSEGLVKNLLSNRIVISVFTPIVMGLTFYDLFRNAAY
jgi:hypothetical protein